MAAWNAESTIRRSIESALEQTRGDLEILVADDGSTDRTVEIAQSIRDPRVIVVESDRPPRSGPSAARNRALARARGEFVGCLDADDRWTPEKLERQLAAVEALPGATAVYGWTDFVDEAGSVRGPDARPTFSDDVLAELLLENFIACGSNSLMRRTTVEEVGGFDETLGGVEDWDLHLKLARRGPFACVPAVVVWYFREAGSQSSRTELMESCWREVADREFAYPDTQGLRREAEARFYAYLTGRAVEGGRGASRWSSAARYTLQSLSSHPAGFAAFAKGLKVRLLG